MRNGLTIMRSMGIFGKLGKVVDAVLDLTDDSSQGIGERREAPPVELRADATPLADLQALAATSGGRSGRAVVQYTDGVSAAESGSSEASSDAVLMGLRVRLLDGGFGPRIEKRVMLPRLAGLLIGAGLEVPVDLHPTTGELEGVDRTALIEELRPQFAQALADEQARQSFTLTAAAASISNAFDDLRTADAAAAAEAAAQTVEGVSVDQWLLARKVLATGRIPDAIRDRTLAAYGVPAGRWAFVDQAWSARAASDPGLAARLAAASR